MIELTNNLEYLVKQISEYIAQTSEEKITEKQSPEKWSKKEILGHLIDSGIHNLQRFTEIQFQTQPSRLKSYNQDELVKANKYQETETYEILILLKALNRRIIEVIIAQTEATLDYKIITENGTSFNFKYLIDDYISHFEHHLKQIKA
ncbi:MAG: DinB family protein [Chitinophagales bacterium]